MERISETINALAWAYALSSLVVVVFIARDVARQMFGRRIRRTQEMLVRVYRDGNRWCALHGENLQDGEAGFGVTPSAALRQLAAVMAQK